MSTDARSATLLATVLALSTTAVTTGCDRGPRTTWSGVVDTLESGTVRVDNPARGVWDDGSRWSLVEDLRLGAVEAESPELFGRIAALEVDDAGRIYVLDADAAEVRVFGPDGTHLRSFGRRGQGPGELEQPLALAVDTGGRVWVVDPGNQRYTLFDTTGALVTGMRRFTAGHVAPWPGAILDDGRIVDVDLGPEGAVLTVHGPGGETLDTIVPPAFEAPRFTLTTEHSRTTVSVPFAPRLFQVVDSRGYLWTGVSDDYRIVQRDLTGRDSLLIVRREYDPVPVTDREVDAALERYGWFREQGGRMDRSRIPDHHPAFDGFLVDRTGYLWVEPVTTPREAREPAAPEARPGPSVFDVFDEAGRYLGRLDAGLPLLWPLVTRSHLYGVTTDDLGVPYVVRMRIVGRPATR